MVKVKATIKILNYFSGSVLFESEKETIKEAVQDADLQDADLRGADLQGADLQGAVLRGADLQGAVLRDADLRGADLQGADLQGADLRGAVLQGADLRGIPMENLPQSYIDDCSKDILYILHTLKAEVPFLKQKLLAGEVDGSQYTGSCACLVGALAKAKSASTTDTDIDNFCNAIPFYRKGTHNPGEQWFLNINEDDTPSDNLFSKHALKLCNMVLGLPDEDGMEEPVEIVEVAGKKYRKADVEDRLKELETI